MAPWQFRTKIVPTGALLENNRSPERDEEDVQRFWANYSAPNDVVRALSDLLPEVSSWSSSATMFGESKGDRVEIWREDGKLAWISISFSLSHPNLEFMKNALKTVSALKCQFLDVQLKTVFEPNPRSFTEHVQQCSAARYLPATVELSKLIE